MINIVVKTKENIPVFLSVILLLVSQRVWAMPEMDHFDVDHPENICVTTICKIEKILWMDEKADENRDFFYKAITPGNGSKPLTEFDPEHPYRICASALCVVEKKLWKEQKEARPVIVDNKANQSPLRVMTDNEKALFDALRTNRVQGFFKDEKALKMLVANCMADNNCLTGLQSSLVVFKENYRERYIEILGRVNSEPQSNETSLAANGANTATPPGNSIKTTPLKIKSPKVKPPKIKPPKVKPPKIKPPKVKPPKIKPPKDS